MGTVNLPPYLDKIQRAIEGLIDRADKIVSIAANAGVAYVGYKALQHPMGALVGILGLKMVESDNLAAGAAGVATLTGLGALNMIPPTQPLPGAGQPIEDLLAKLKTTGWTPSTPISETPEEQIMIKTTGGYYMTL